MESGARPGAAIKALRRKLDFTLAEVSVTAGIPISTLSRIENDQARPTYDHLLRLSQGLRVDIGSLLSVIKGDTSASRSGRRSINRVGDGVAVDSRHHMLKYLSTDLRDKQITPILGEITTESIAAYGTYLRHPGEEFVFVVSGTLELHSEAYSPVVLETGESMYFDSSMGHAYVRVGPEPCVILSICTVPNDEIPVREASAARHPAKSGRSGGRGRPKT
jgi:transcriptional regulator with XRE-family HTH domain